jgi:hypothetical protein
MTLQWFVYPSKGQTFVVINGQARLVSGLREAVDLVGEMAAVKAEESERKSWCKAKHGRQRELAALLGVSEELVSNWLARRKTSTLQRGLEIQEFLKKSRER